MKINEELVKKSLLKLNLQTQQNSLNENVASTSFLNKTENLIRYQTSKKDDTGPVQKKREFHSMIVFLFFLFITIITLSQILVMHNQTSNTNFHQIKLMQEELKLMDFSIDKMLKQNDVLPMQIWYSLKQYKDNIKKFQNYLTFISNLTYQHNCEYLINNAFLNMTNHSLTTSLLKDVNNIDCLQEFLVNISNVFDDKIIREQKFKFLNNDNNKLIHELFLKTSKNNSRNEVITNIVNKISYLNSSRKNVYKNYCSELPSGLTGPIYVDDKRLSVDFLHIVEQENNVVEFGGKWTPSDFQSRHRVSTSSFILKFIKNKLSKNFNYELSI